MRSVAIKIGILAAVLITIGISLRNLSTLGAPTGEFGVFMVHPATSILRFEELGHACGGPNHHGSQAISPTMESGYL
jgi:hypothetical protein